MSDTTTPATLPAETAPAPYRQWRDKKVVLTAALASVLAVALAACGSTQRSSTPASASTTAPAHAAPATPATHKADPAVGVFTLSDTIGNRYTIQLVKVTDPAVSDDPVYHQPDAGYHYAGVTFRVQSIDPAPILATWPHSSPAQTGSSPPQGTSTWLAPRLRRTAGSSCSARVSPPLSPSRC